MGDVALGFPDTWMWLIFVSIGLIFVLLELLLGVETGLDLVFVGSALIIGGLTTLAAHSWVITLIVSLLICVAYLAIGRRYVHRWTATKKEKTNVDVLIGKTGIVLEGLSPGLTGIVKVGTEEWRARAEENIEKGEMIVVTGINGVTLDVKKS